MKYLIAVKIGPEVEIFEFDTPAERDNYIEAIKEMPGVEYSTSELAAA